MTAPDGFLGPGANGVERLAHVVRVLLDVLGVEDNVDVGRLEVPVLDVLEDEEVLEREDGLVEPEPLAVAVGGLEQVGFGPDRT